MHVAITGASAGIGEALAREMAAAGAELTLVARRRELLEKIAAEVGVRTHLVEHDLSVPARCAEWLEPAQAALGPIDVLVNNAGVQIIGATASADLDRMEALLAINLHTPLRLTRAVLPAMLARKSGTIVDISSLAALAPTPGMTWYNASKAGLAAASEGLRGELRGTGVHVVTVYPGPVDTAMGAAGYRAYQKSLALSLSPQGTAPALARKVRRAIERRRDRVIYPASYAVVRRMPALTRWFLDRFTPPLKPGV